MTLLHFVMNEGQLVQAVSIMQARNTQSHVTLTFDLWPWYSVRFQRLSRYVTLTLWSACSSLTVRQ